MCSNITSYRIDVENIKWITKLASNYVKLNNLCNFDKKVSLVAKKSDFQQVKKRESSQGDVEKTSDKSDDPIRMYLREMGGVELLLSLIHI